MIRLLLQNRNFALLFSGRLVTNIGDCMYAIASMWLVYELGGSAFYTGLAGFLIYLPEIFAVFLGPIIDRSDKKKILIYSELTQCFLIALIPILYNLNMLTVEAVLVIMPLAALCVQFTYPSESALLPRTVEAQHIVEANSAMSFAYRGTSLLFKGLAGIIVTAVGAVNVYKIDVITFLFAAMLFKFMTVRESQTRPNENSVTGSQSFLKQYRKDLMEGLSFLKRPLFFKLKLPGVIINFFYSATFASLPAFAAKHGGVTYYGMFSSAIFGGMLIGSLFAHKVSKKYPIGKLMTLSGILTGCLWIISYLLVQQVMILGLVFLFFTGLPWGVGNVVSSSLTQKVVPQQMMARVSSAVGTMLTIGMPFGALFGGWLATMVGPEVVIYVYGSMTIALRMYWLFDKSVYTLPNIDQIDEKTLERYDRVPYHSSSSNSSFT